MANGTDDEQSRAIRERAQTTIRHQLGQYTPGEIRGLNLHPEVNPNLPVNLAIRASEALKARDRVEQGRAATATFPQQREGPGVILGRSGGGVQSGLVGVAGDEGSGAIASGGGFRSPTAPAVDTDALIGQAIQGRQQIEAQRGGIEARRSALIKELGTLPVLKKGVNPRAKAIEAELGQLHDQNQLLSGQERELHENLTLTTQGAFRNASMAHRMATDAASKKTAEQAGEVFLRGTEIFNKYKAGDPRINEEMGKLREQFPEGFNSLAVKGHFGKLAAFHDQEAEANQKRLATKLFAGTGLSPEQFANATNIRGTNTAPNAKTPPTLEQIEAGRKDTGPKGEKAKYIAADVDGETHLFAKGLFNNLSSAFRPRQDNDLGKAAPSTTVSAAPATEDAGDVNAAIREGRIVASPQRTAQAQAAATPVPQAAAAPVATNLPKVGDTRVVGTTTFQWNGNRWDPQ